MKTQPIHVLDTWLWPLLLVWEFFSKKRSHWWHWVDYPGEIRQQELVPGESKAGDRSKSRLAMVLRTSFGWKTAVILEPVNYTGEYQLGFRATEGKRGLVTQLCTIVLKGQVASLVGPYDNEFFVVTLDGESIELRVVDLTIKKKLSKTIRLI